MKFQKTISIIIVGSDIPVFAQMLEAEWQNCLNDGSLTGINVSQHAQWEGQYWLQSQPLIALFLYSWPP